MLDRFEQNDLAGVYPAVVKELSERWYVMAEIRDLLPGNKRGPVRDAPASNTHHEWHKPALTEGWEPF